jgi:AcrR family transcriptional regulator
MENRRKRKKEQAKERLYKAAIHLFVTKGYESTTIQEITDLADMSKATFFNYFPTKEHVLAEYHNEMTRSILETLQSSSYPAASQAILSAMNVFAQWAEKSVSIGRILLRVVFGSEILKNADQENEKRFNQWIEEQVENGVRNGEILPHLDVSLFTSLIIAVLSSTVQEWFMSEQEFDLRPTLEKRVAFLLKAATVQNQTFGIIQSNR